MPSGPPNAPPSAPDTNRPTRPAWHWAVAFAALVLAALATHAFASLRASDPVVLTIDDGPENTRDDRQILRILRAHHVHAIWFITCKNLDPALNPRAEEHRALLREIVAEGDVVANHGYTHQDLSLLKPELLDHEIGDCSRLIAQVAGVSPRYFRPPFGKHAPAVLAAARRAGMTPMFWSVNSYDSLFARFKRQPLEYERFLRDRPELDPSQAQPGAIVLLHDYPNTARALDGMLARMEHSGIVFGTPPQAVR